MRKNIWKYTLMLTLATSIVFSGTANAATTQEKQVTTAFAKYKTGMTIAEFAKQRYGKTYKKHLTKKNGRTILKEKSPKEETSKDLDFVFYFIPGKQETNYMTFLFASKPKDKVYRLALRSLEFSGENPMGVRQSDKQLKRGKQVEYDMTEQQLDNVLTGKGLGDWMTWSTTDFSHSFSKQELKKMGLGEGKTKIYIFRTNHPNKRLQVHMTFDSKKKTYRVDWMENISSTQELY
ncbi:hypothetical protein [Exiguobacterium sp. 17-1]|uniref:hypothetical protein n=1 Tax=Exiguobacterium sp. 17-1 TaxID=2931981 RepID=UPI001FFE91BE|nr:hypothetical protein [Exiguobacterium sp. 17-1]MCK2156159.1 hypothetical protein [Exiguobacterium sp. 17-1]